MGLQLPGLAQWAQQNQRPVLLSHCSLGGPPFWVIWNFPETKKLLVSMGFKASLGVTGGASTQACEEKGRGFQEARVESQYPGETGSDGWVCRTGEGRAGATGLTCQETLFAQGFHSLGGAGAFTHRWKVLLYLCNVLSLCKELVCEREITDL